MGKLLYPQTTDRGLFSYYLKVSTSASSHSHPPLPNQFRNPVLEALLDYLNPEPLLSQVPLVPGYHN